MNFALGRGSRGTYSLSRALKREREHKRFRGHDGKERPTQSTLLRSQSLLSSAHGEAYAAHRVRQRTRHRARQGALAGADREAPLHRRGGPRHGHVLSPGLAAGGRSESLLRRARGPGPAWRARWRRRRPDRLRPDPGGALPRHREGSRAGHEQAPRRPPPQAQRYRAEGLTQGRIPPHPPTEGEGKVERERTKSPRRRTGGEG